jgi:hypothetical protein
MTSSRELLCGTVAVVVVLFCVALFGDLHILSSKEKDIFAESRKSELPNDLQVSELRRNGQTVRPDPTPQNKAATQDAPAAFVPVADKVSSPSTPTVTTTQSAGDRLDELFHLGGDEGNTARLAMFHRVSEALKSRLDVRPMPQKPNPTQREEYVTMGAKLLADVDAGVYLPVMDAPAQFAVCLGIFLDTESHAALDNSLRRLFLLFESWMADFPYRYIYSNVAIPELGVRQAYMWTGGKGVYQAESMYSLPICQALYPKAEYYIIADEDVAVNRTRLLEILPAVPAAKGAVYGTQDTPTNMYWGIWLANQRFMPYFKSALVETLQNGYTNAFIPGSLFHNDHLLTSMLLIHDNLIDRVKWQPVFMDFDAVNELQDYKSRNLALFHHITRDFLRRYVQEWMGHPRPLFCGPVPPTGQKDLCGFKP